MAMLRLVADCNAATAAAVISTLTYCLCGASGTGMVASTLVESIDGSGSVFAAKVSLQLPVTMSTLRFAAVLVLMT
jgi:hypothetical protein